MARFSSTASRPPRALAIVFAVGLIGLLGLTGASVWMASAWDFGGMMGSDHMGGMMAGGRDASGDPSRQGAATESIVIDDFEYSPGNLQVPVGADVTWTNRDSVPHSATAKDGSWDTGLFNKDKARTLNFTTSGTFDYYCTLHPAMKGKLVVE